MLKFIIIFGENIFFATPLVLLYVTVVESIMVSLRSRRPGIARKLTSSEAARELMRYGLGEFCGSHQFCHSLTRFVLQPYNDQSELHFPFKIPTALLLSSSIHKALYMDRVSLSPSAFNGIIIARGYFQEKTILYGKVKHTRVLWNVKHALKVDRENDWTISTPFAMWILNKTHHNRKCET